MKKELDMSWQAHNFIGEAFPIGFLDLTRALEVIVESGLADEYEANSQLWKILEEYNLSVGNSNLDSLMFEDGETPVDLCGLVYEEILQEAREEIDSLTQVDIQEEFMSFMVSSNYMCSSFDYQEEDVQKLKELLEEKDIEISNFKEPTHFFLDQIGLNDLQKGGLK